MRVLLFLPSLATGGAERQFAQIAAGLAARGHQVRLATLYPPEPGEIDLDGRVERHALFGRKGSRLRRPLQFLGLRARWQKLLAHYRPEVVLSGLYIGNLLAHRGLRSAGVPLVWSFRGSRQELSRIQSFGFRYCRAHAPELPLAIFNSESGRRHHLERGFRLPACEVISNGIDTDHFTRDEDDAAAFRRAWKLPAGAPTIGIVARLTAVKDHGLFLRTAARVAALHEDVRFVCVGDGPAPLRAELEADAHRLGLTEKLVFTGLLSDTRAAHRALDVLASTSRGEGFPNVLGEAMACETPCVATDVGDSAHIVGDAGIVVPPADLNAQVAAWTSLLALSIEERRELGRRARSRILERFSLAACVTATEAALARVSADSTAPRPSAAGSARARSAP